MLLFDPDNWKRWHRDRFRICGTVALLALAWFLVEAVRTGRFPGGSSPPGLAAGIFAGLTMLYLFAYGVRKWPVLNLWFLLRPTKARLAQHIWLGLLTLPLVMIHGWQIGGYLTTALLIVYAVVMISGIYGLWRQQGVPHEMLEEIPEETIRSQIPDLLNQLSREAELLVLATCGPPPDPQGTAKALEILKQNREIIKANQAGRGTGLLRILPATPIAGTEPLRVYFEDVLQPYLTPDSSAGKRTRLRARLKQDFTELRGRLTPESHPVIDALEQLCERRQQFDHQAQMHGRLHGWIGFHLVFSAMLLFLLIWHAVSAVLYW
jgi:hypothetical protein